jgi:hypothetical protein
MPPLTNGDRGGPLEDQADGGSHPGKVIRRDDHEKAEPQESSSLARTAERDDCGLGAGPRGVIKRTRGRRRGATGKEKGRAQAWSRREVYENDRRRQSRND